MSQEIDDSVEALRFPLAFIISVYLLFPLFYYYESFWYGLFFFVFACMFFFATTLGFFDPVIRYVVQWNYNRRGA